MKKATTIIVLILVCIGTGIHAQVLDSCGQWAHYCDGTYCVYNNLWGENVGTQCITASSTTRFSVTSNQTGTGVKTYPNSSREPIGVTIGSLKSLTSSMNVSSPTNGDYCTAWDIWAPEEVMVWMNKYGNVSPWGSFVETATIGGVTWDVYKNGYPGFVRQSNTNSMTVDLKAILNYCVNKGWLSSSGIIEKVQGGFEITATVGSQTFTMNSYSVSIDSTEPIEQPPEPPPASETPQVGMYYRILAGHSGKALTVENKSTAPGANVIQWSYENSPHQEWLLEEAGASGPGYYLLTNRNSGMVLEVQDWSTADGGNVRQGSFAAYQNNQQWSLTRDGDYYQIINRNSGLLVDVEATSGNNGANIHQWSHYSDNANSQRWSFQSAGGTPVTPAPTSVSTSTPTPGPTQAPTRPQTHLGDVNGDSAIDIVDALLIAQYYVGLNPANFDITAADTNCSGSVDIVDALLIAQFYVGLVTDFC
ncbi:MAG: RICIN domain-containing protein [Spirochaetales bacterium]|nr:RICIN domain-containing protein [Spirochaetales bacterium]